LSLKRASASRSSGQWSDDDFDVLADGAVVGRIFKANAAPVGSPWMWTLAFGHHEGRTPTHGYAATRRAAMAAFVKSWRREPEVLVPSLKPSGIVVIDNLAAYKVEGRRDASAFAVSNPPQVLSCFAAWFTSRASRHPSLRARSSSSNAPQA
jgi:hypothetical protein